MTITHTTPADGTFSAAGDAAWDEAHTVADNTLVAAKLSASDTDIIFGRSTAGAGAGEEVPCTAAGRALLDDAAASDQRTTLGLGTIATQSAASVAITGGTITGITDLAVADGGTGASSARPAAQNLAVGYLLETTGAVTAPASDTNENILWTINLPVMAANDWLEIVGYWTVTANGNVKTVRARMDGISGTIFYSMAMAGLAEGETRIFIINQNATNANLGWGQRVGNNGNTTASVKVAGTVETNTGSVTLVITAQKATGTDTMTINAGKCVLWSNGA